MNAVEIEAALSELALKPFDFPFEFLAPFGNKDTTLKRLRKGDSNATDVLGAALQCNHIRILVTKPGEVGAGLTRLRESPKTVQAKAKFLLATDGVSVDAGRQPLAIPSRASTRHLPVSSRQPGLT